MDIRSKILPVLLFSLVASPAAFKVVRNVGGDLIASTYGVPTCLGLFVHAVVFVLLLQFLSALLAKSGKSGYAGSQYSGQVRNASPYSGDKSDD